MQLHNFDLCWSLFLTDWISGYAYSTRTVHIIQLHSHRQKFIVEVHLPSNNDVSNETYFILMNVGSFSIFESLCIKLINGPAHDGPIIMRNFVWQNHSFHLFARKVWAIFAMAMSSVDGLLVKFKWLNFIRIELILNGLILLSA